MAKGIKFVAEHNGKTFSRTSQSREYSFVVIANAHGKGAQPVGWCSRRDLADKLAGTTRAQQCNCSMTEQQKAEYWRTLGRSRREWMERNWGHPLYSEVTVVPCKQA